MLPPGEPPGGWNQNLWCSEDVLYASYPHYKMDEWAFLENPETDFCHTKQIDIKKHMPLYENKFKAMKS